MKENVLLEKSFAFAIRVVNAYKYLVEEKKEFVKEIKEKEGEGWLKSWWKKKEEIKDREEVKEEKEETKPEEKVDIEIKEEVEIKETPADELEEGLEDSDHHQKETVVVIRNS